MEKKVKEEPKTGPKKAKTTTRKTVAKKTTISKKSALNETIKDKKEIVVDKEMQECVYCHELFNKGLTICPHCRRRQKMQTGLLFFLIIGAILLFAIACFKIVEDYFKKTDGMQEYVSNCILVSYENLVRTPKEYKDTDVKIIGEVVSVSGYDTGFANNMTITINTNLFDQENEQLITVTYNDEKYEHGFIAGDYLTVYGVYNEINGNIPNIDAEYVVMGNKNNY